MRGLAWIGPVDCDIWNPQFTWAGAPTNNGMRAASLVGVLPWAKVTQLQELVANPDRHVTIGGESGVLEYVWSDDRYLEAFRGWYLLQTVAVNANVEHSENDAVVAFQVGAVLVGDHRQPVVVRSSRARSNAHSLAGAEVVAAPLTVSAGNAGFVASPGGTLVVRAFDAAHGDDLFDLAVDARTVDVHVAAVGTLADRVAPLVEDDAKPASWVALRGGDCRAYDVSQGRAVYGPSHPLAEPSDLVLENGLIRAWCGPRGVVPYFTMMGFAGGAWRQLGCVVLADETDGPVLDRARLVAVTPDFVTAALSVRGLGDIYVTLRRGERMLRIQHGGTRAPTIAAYRSVRWLGTPPTVHGLGDAAAGGGEFGAGLAVNTHLVEFQWPQAATQAAWSIRGAWPTDADSATQVTSGIVALLSTGEVVASIEWDDSDGAFVVRLGADELRTAPVTFDAGDVIPFVAAFDTTNGLTLAVNTADQGIVRAADATLNTAPSAAPIRRLLVCGVPADAAAFGEGDFGDEPFGEIVPNPTGVDEVYVYAGRLSVAQADAALAPGQQLGDVPFDPRPVWYAAFDADLSPTAGPLAAGLRSEAAPDDYGFSRIAASLGDVIPAAPLGVTSAALAATADFVAGLATASVGDTATDLHVQFAAASEQETRIR